ncbi:hypothetical protein FB381_2867 [Nocardioides albertanoniae]|uniref:Uncharacterized protein n=1 Tax=Nocardioides albertanoniae TaxID=1175486 RepID=A0A543A905_9ACTN|nr:hypothetical protein [Nocardioides albertanoniae]TQL68966.1 hypothetical protein FB381_2867 [Nocardioides albertanoniae]
MDDTNGAGADALRARVERRVSGTPTGQITAATVDEIVLQETGTDKSLTTLLSDAEETRFGITGGARAALNAGTSLNCFGLLAVVAAAAAWGGVFGRYESPGWTWMVPTLAPVVAAAAVIVAIFSLGRPATRMASGGISIGFVIIAVAGGVTSYAFDLEPTEQWSIWASIAVGGAAVVWLHLVRLLNSDESRDLELALLRARREARALLAEERARFLPRLEGALHAAQADLDELETLWTFAADRVAKRGVTLDRADGPVGASLLASILSIPHDAHDRAGEDAEAEWEKKRSIQ